MIAVLDYGMGNVGSILNMVKRVGEKRVVITRDIQQIQMAEKLILPGVGSFDMGMDRLKETGLDVQIKIHAMEKHKPILGICLGMQLLGKSSEEGQKPGLGLIPFSCKRFSFEEGSLLKVPHMGWDRTYVQRETELTKGIQSPQRYYFVHSYYAVCENKSNILMTCEYGAEFTAAVSQEQIYGVQFHPEKSHKFGMKLMKNFVEM